MPSRKEIFPLIIAGLSPCGFRVHVMLQSLGSPRAIKKQKTNQKPQDRKLTCPSADQAREVHCGGSALLLVLITSCLSSSTMTFPSRSWWDRKTKTLDAYHLKRHQKARVHWSELSETASCIITGLQKAFGFHHRISRIDSVEIANTAPNRSSQIYACFSIEFPFTTLT